MKTPMQRIGELAMEFAEQIVAEYGPDVAIGAVMIVADVTDVQWLDQALSGAPR